MKIKEFEALTLKECLQQVRQELGSEAVILETRKFRKGGILGWGAKDAVRIVAGTGISVNEPRANGTGYRSERTTEAASRNRASSPATSVRTASNNGSSDGGTQVAERPVAVLERPVMQEDAINPAGPETVPSKQKHEAFNAEAFFAARHSVMQDTPTESGHDAVTQDKLNRLEKEMREIRDGIHSLQSVRHAVVTPYPASRGSSAKESIPAVPYPELYQKIRKAEVNEELAVELLHAMPDLSGWGTEARTPLAESALRELMANRVKSGGPITMNPAGPRVVTFVGPTGVGKTTTIAKLAAHFALIEKRKVGLLTMDTYRIAAVEQLKTYSQIIDIPVQVAYNQSEVAPALEKFKDCDLILIDTAGRSQKNIMQISELKTLVDTAGCETHLVLAASTKERDLLDQVARFSGAGVDRLLFTKLDETTTYGTMFTVAARSGIPVSYITTGQKVPEDIEAANGANYAAMVMYSGAL